MRFLFLLPVLSDSYYQKRINHLERLGIEPTIYGFRRNHYEGKPWKLDVISLGKVRHGRYLQRIGTLFKSIFRIRRAAANQDVIYSFSFDTLLLSWISTFFQDSEKKIVYEVEDIRTVLVQKNLLSNFLRVLERFLLRRVSVVVVPSPAYVDGYFKSIQNAQNTFVVIENKVDIDLSSKVPVDSIRSDRDSDSLTIGYFGMIRCEQSLQLLKALLKKCGRKVNLNLKGVFLGTEQYKDYFLDSEFAKYGGTFVYPDDLEQMYASVDLVWAAHSHGETNTKWSISNRFYQACYFNKPLIAQKNTQDAKRVLQYNIGCVIDMAKIENSIDRIKSIDQDEIAIWKQNMHQLPKDIYTFTNEHERLLELIQTSNIQR